MKTRVATLSIAVIAFFFGGLLSVVSQRMQTSTKDSGISRMSIGGHSTQMININMVKPSAKQGR